MEPLLAILALLVVVSLFVSVLRPLIFGLLVGVGIFWAAHAGYLPISVEMAQMLIPVCVVVVAIAAYTPKPKKEKKD